MSKRHTLLITGGSGFLASWCVVRALQNGWKVRATLRNPAREPRLRAAIAPEIDAQDRLAFHHVDLLSDAGWAEAMAGVKAVLHIASPFPSRGAHSETLLTPARDGTLRVLKAAKAAGVRRVVVTSALAAAAHRGLRELAGAARARPLTNESDWTDPAQPGLSKYAISKVAAERAAWDWTQKFDSGQQLTTILPGMILGPPLDADLAPPQRLLRRLLDGLFPALPALPASIVDVRDLADLHLKALDAPGGERFIATADETVTPQQAARILKAHLGRIAARASELAAPAPFVLAAALAAPALAETLSVLAGGVPGSNAKARAKLDWAPRPVAQTLLDTAQRLLALGALKPPRRPFEIPNLEARVVQLGQMLRRARASA